MSIREVKCTKCKNYIISDSYIPICRAFPDRIPREIWSEEVDHIKPYPGDNGIQFEPSVDDE